MLSIQRNKTHEISQRRRQISVKRQKDVNMQQKSWDWKSWSFYVVLQNGFLTESNLHFEQEELFHYTVTPEFVQIFTCWHYYHPGVN